MRRIEETDVDWAEINRLRNEFRDRLSSPEYDAVEEAARPFQGAEWLMYLPWELMSGAEKARWVYMEKHDLVTRDDLLRIEE